MAKLKCQKCGHEEEVPQHCGKPMHLEKVEGREMLVCWMGTECGKQEPPNHCGQSMILEP